MTTASQRLILKGNPDQPTSKPAADIRPAAGQDEAASWSFDSRWLVLSHAFNMDGRAASQTVTDKLPHLIAAGVEPIVLSGVSGHLDDTVEHYQLLPAGPAGLRFDLRHVLRQRYGKGIRYRLMMLAISTVLLPGMVLEKLFRPYESSWSWWWPAYRKGLHLIRKRGIDVIYSSGGAYAAHLAAEKLKRATGLPWIAEIHDPLVHPGSTPSSPREKMQAEVERLVCSHADIAIWFTDQALASARARHPQLGGRGRVMLPGVDAPLATLPPYRPGKTFVIGHFGSLSPTRHLGPLVDALEELQGRRDDLLDNLEVHIYGGGLDPISAANIDNSPLKDRFKLFGRLESNPATGESGRDRVLGRMRSADVLLLLHGEEPVCSEYIPSKLYEYLWMQRPVLAVVHQNPQMHAIVRGEGHVAVEAGETAALSAAIENLFDRWKKDGLPDNGRASPYTTGASVGQLVKWARSIGEHRA